MTSAAGFEPDLTRWEPWRPQEVQRRLARVRAPWCVTAGWAIDLFLGEERRPHDDIEIAVPHDRFAEIADELTGFDLFVAGGEDGRGLVWPLPAAAERLETSHQTWVREPATELWRLDVLREPSDGGTWICRRDGRIRMPHERLIERSLDGIPYARPETVLLFKAKHVRPKDEADLADVLPRLGPEGRRWLARALALVHPGHAWLGRL